MRIIGLFSLLFTLLLLACGEAGHSPQFIDAGLTGGSSGTGGAKATGGSVATGGSSASICYTDGDCATGLMCANGTCIKPGSLECPKGQTATSVTTFYTEGATAGECDQTTYTAPHTICVGPSDNSLVSSGSCPTNNLFASCIVGLGPCNVGCTNCKITIFWYMDSNYTLSEMQTACGNCAGALTEIGCSTDGCSCLSSTTCDSKVCTKGLCGTGST
jgi:hypothetical protein